VEFCFSPLNSLSPPPVSSTSLPPLQWDLRTAKTSDLRGIAEILTHCFHPPEGWVYWFHPLLKLGIYEDLRYRLRQEAPHYQCLAAIDPQQQILGTVEMSLRPSIGLTSFPYLSNLAVSPSHQRKGIARQLLTKCEQISLEWGYDRLFLHVLDHNLPAKHLYYSKGYELHHVEWSVLDWAFHRSRRLLLYKKLES
jgi:ribosomal protein S18 acetylase RimI-like enzyme